VIDFDRQLITGDLADLAVTGPLHPEGAFPSTMIGAERAWLFPFFIAGGQNMSWNRNTSAHCWLVAATLILGALSWNSSARSELPMPPVTQSAAPAVQAPANSQPAANPSSERILELIGQALQDDENLSRSAIVQLRRIGPAAVRVLMTNEEIRTSPRWTTVLDAVAQQKDARYSGLYWYTDLNEACAAARRENKPILSLRLLGNLTDELSCANSRFFRTTLYPNPLVRDLLAGQFVLHWQSVRAVPIVTIDFGDGRKLQRTITGNSLHLVLDAEGRPVDVIPGLYTAGMFARNLVAAHPVALQCATLTESEFTRRRCEYHTDRLKTLSAAWDESRQQAGLPALGVGIEHSAEIWNQAAKLAGAEPVLVAETQQAVAEHAPPANVAGRLAVTKAVAEAPVMRLVRNVSRIINEDSLRNEYHLHVRIHQWFAMGMPIPPREQLVAHVYSEMFLSPLNDPWYGLSNPDIYSAIQNDGRINAAVTQNTGR
jgi:hypothetical protein